MKTLRDIDSDVHADSRYNMVLIDQEMYELCAPENEGRVLLQHKVCISVACEMIVIGYCCCINKVWKQIWNK